ncbi:Jun dimerization protein 2 [Manis javanica]|nr:Jun dimerization protein 2 [Manis javanica]
MELPPTDKHNEAQQKLLELKQTDLAETPEKAWQLAESIAFSEEAVDPGGCPVLSGLSAVSHLPPDGSEASRGVRRIQDTKYTQTRHRLEVADVGEHTAEGDEESEPLRDDITWPRETASHRMTFTHRRLHCIMSPQEREHVFCHVFLDFQRLIILGKLRRHLVTLAVGGRDPTHPHHIGDCYVGSRQLETIFNRQHFRTINDSLAAAGPRPRGRRLRPRLLHGWIATPPAMMPGQIPDPSVTAGSLPGLGPLTGLPGSALTAEELKYADIRNIGAMIAPLHFLEVKLGKRPQPVKSELDEEEERRKRRREKNKVAAARCRNKKKERTEFLQRESERLELMNAELKTQIEELKQERQQLILMLNRHRPTCIVRTDSVKTPESEGNPLLEQLEKK